MSYYSNKWSENIYVNVLNWSSKGSLLSPLPSLKYNLPVYRYPSSHKKDIDKVVWVLYLQLKRTCHTFYRVGEGQCDKPQCQAWNILKATEVSQPKQNRKIAQLLLGNKSFKSNYINFDFQFVSITTIM